MRSVRGRTVVVTGAGRGLGRGVAVGLARAGAKVIACDRTEAELERTAGIIRSGGGDVEIHRFDLGEPGTPAAFAESLVHRDAVEVLINNAAVLRREMMAEMAEASWTETLAVNLTAPFLLIRSFLPLLLANGGSIVNVSSRAGVSGFSGEAAYCASKFGLEGMTRALARELEGTSVSANTVTPGLPIKPTSLTDAEAARSAEEWHDPLEIAPAFVFLASLRGEVNGCRFDAFRLTAALARKGGSLSAAELRELAE